MATLTVWKFDDPNGAEQVLQELEGLQKQALLKVLDGAVVSWPAGAKRPKTSQLADMTGRGALGGAFWGFLFGLIFFVPLLGMAVGAAAGALGGSMAHVGIDKDFIDQVKADPANNPGVDLDLSFRLGSIALLWRQRCFRRRVLAVGAEEDDRALTKAGIGLHPKGQFTPGEELQRGDGAPFRRSICVSRGNFGRLNPEHRRPWFDPDRDRFRAGIAEKDREIERLLHAVHRAGKARALLRVGGE